MPKVLNGTFLKCERSIKLFIKKLNEKSTEKIIIMDLDEYSCLIDSSKKSYVISQINQMIGNFQMDEPKIIKKKICI